jgi:hypothetical protein
MPGCFAGTAANKRVALVIENDRYFHTDTLKNPVNDSKTIADKLKELNFDVQLEHNLDTKGIARAIQRFADKLNKDTDALFYYAGHGLQFGGENYLVAVDATLQSEATLQFETFRLNTIISLLESKAGTTLIFWDGCRNNPLADSLLPKSRPISESSPAVRGSSAPIPPRRGDTFVVFSAEHDKFALDGAGLLSPFAEALAHHIATPNVEIETMLKRVAADVEQTTKSYQRPERLSQLTKEFCFNRQGSEQQAYEIELQNLRAKIAQLERPSNQSNFAIVSSEKKGDQQPSTVQAASPPLAQRTEPVPGPVVQTNAKESPPASAPQSNAKSSPPASAPEAGAKTSPPASAPQINAKASPPASAPEASAKTSPPASAPQINANASSPAPAVLANAAASPPAPAPEPDSAHSDVVVAVNMGESAIIRKLRTSPNGKLLAIGGDDGIIRIVDLAKFEVISVIRAHADRISDLDFAPDSRILLSAGRDGYLRFWDVTTGQRAKADLKVEDAIPYSARLNPQFSNRFVLMGDRDGRLFAWDLIRNHIVSSGKFHSGAVLSVAYQPKGNGTYLSAGRDGLLKIRLPEGERYTIHAHAGAIFDAGYNPSGTLIYSAGTDRRIRIWDPKKLTSEYPYGVLEGHLKYVLAATISPDGKMLASGGGDKAINLWDLQTRALVGRLTGHTGDVEAVTFTPNNHFLISASEDKTVKIWSIDGQKELVRMSFKKNGDIFAGVTFDNKLFGDRNSGLMSIFVSGRAVADQEGARSVTYIGRGITIVDSGRVAR